MKSEMSEVTLRTDFCGIELRNPFLLAPTPATSCAEMIERAFERGWGGAVWKTIGAVPRLPNPKVSPRYATVRSSDQTPVGFGNIDLGNEYPIDVSFGEMRRVKKAFPNRVLVASIRGGDDPAAWQYLAGRAEEAGADLVEVMYSCPHDLVEGDQNDLEMQIEFIGKITGWVCRATSLPVTVKMPANLVDMRPLALRVKRHGAAAIVVANTIRCIAGVDLDTLCPMPSVGGLATYGGYSGPAVKPIFLRFVAELASSSLDLPIAGVGGISCWRDAAEYLLLGASVVQVGTAVMSSGYGIIDDLTDGLRRFILEHGFPDIQSMSGTSLQYLVKHEALSRDSRVVPSFRQEMCIGCGKCYVACRDAGYQAIDFDVERIPRFDLGRCTGCGLCEQVCPAVGCIRMSRVATA